MLKVAIITKPENVRKIAKSLLVQIKPIAFGPLLTTAFPLKAPFKLLKPVKIKLPGLLHNLDRPA
jgi:hypothetical protein